MGWQRTSAGLVLVDRYRDLIEIPAPIRQDLDGRDHFVSDSEGVFAYEDGNCHGPEKKNLHLITIGISNKQLGFLLLRWFCGYR
jgi:hypothetical protein